MQDKEKLKEQLLKGTFHYYKDALFINAKVKNICELTSCLHIYFEGGAIDVDINKIEPIERPSGINEKFRFCYILKSYNNECIGYIGQMEEDKS